MKSLQDYQILPLKSTPTSPNKDIRFSSLGRTYSRQGQRHQGSPNCSPTNASTQARSSLTLGGDCIISGITDFNDKSQIQKAIEVATSKEDKIRIIDLIMKQRKEKAKRKRNNSKLSTNASNNLQNGYQVELPTNTINRFRRSVQEFYKEESSRDEIILPTPLLTDKPSTPVAFLFRRKQTEEDINKDISESEISEDYKQQVVFPTEETPRVARKISSDSGQPNIALKTTQSLTGGFRFGAGNNTGDSFFSRKTSSGSSFQQNNRKLRKAEGLQTIPQGINIYAQAAGNNESMKFEKSKILEPSSLERRAGSDNQEADLYVLAGKQLEKDLYKYLIKNEDNEEEQKLVLELNYQRKEKMRNIEEKALKQFKEAQSYKQEDLSYYLNNLLRVKVSRIEKARAESVNGPKKRELTHIKPRPEAKGLVRLDQTKSPSFVRRLDSKKVFNNEPFLPKGTPKVRRVDLNDSLTSYTETRLDCLYKQAHRIKKSIKQIEQKMGATQDPQESKTLVKVRNMKMKDLHEYSSKIKILIKKKILDVFA